MKYQSAQTMHTKEWDQHMIHNIYFKVNVQGKICFLNHTGLDIHKTEKEGRKIWKLQRINTQSNIFAQYYFFNKY